MKQKTTLKESILRFFFILAAVLAFTFLDWIMHKSWAYLNVPSWYFVHKIIYGTIWAYLASFFFRQKSIAFQAAWITVVTVVLLQIRYAMYGYPLLFHVVVLGGHLIFLYMPTYAALRIMKKIKI